MLSSVLRSGLTRGQCLEFLFYGYRAEDKMATFLNLGRIDRALRVVLGIGLGVAGILVNGHPYLGWALGLAGASVILSGTCGM